MVMQYGLLRGESARNDGTLIFRVLIGTPSLRASNGFIEAWQSIGGDMVMQHGLLRGESARNDGVLVFMVLIRIPSLRTQ